MDSNKSLSKDSDSLLCSAYKEYMNRRKQGVDKDKAIRFYDREIIAFDSVNMSNSDIISTCMDLNNSGLFSCKKYVDGSLSEIRLTDQGVIYMENRFPNGIKQVVDFLKTIKELNPMN